MNAGRITTAMVQRNVLADLNAVSARLTRSQMKAASGKEITRPSDDPFNTARALGMRQALEANRQYQRNIDSARGWQDATESALSSITDYVQRAKELVVQGAGDTASSTSRASLADEIDQIVQGIKESANVAYDGRYLFGGTETAAPPYAMGADDAYRGDEAGLDPALPGILREIGPGVTMSINVVGRELLGDGQAAADGRLLNVLRDAADHLRAGDGPALQADLGRLDDNLDTVLQVRARNGARSNRLDAAASRLQELEEATTKQLSETEEADLAKTLIDLNSQSAAYQAALRAGANIVQSSLMDFLD